MTTLDANDPRVWFRMLVDSVIAYRTGDRRAGRAYIAFVREHRGADVALAVGSCIKQLAAAESWKDCAMWPIWGYATSAPTKPNPTRKKR